MDWGVARDTCLSMNMKMPLLKTTKDMDEVAADLRRLSYGKFIENRNK